MTASIKHFHKGARFSRAVVHNGTAYFAGLTADDRSGDIEAQTREILAKADALLLEVGSERPKLLRAMIWLRDINDFPGMNAAWEKWVDKNRPPTRATVESKLAAADVLIEIQFTAAVD